MWGRLERLVGQANLLPKTVAVRQLTMSARRSATTMACAGKRPLIWFDMRPPSLPETLNRPDAETLDPTAWLRKREPRPMKHSPRSAARGDRVAELMKPKAHASEARPIGHDVRSQAIKRSSRLRPNAVLSGSGATEHQETSKPLPAGRLNT